MSTAVGFRTLRAEDYARAVEKLGADIAVGLGDIPFGRALGSKRVEKATDRTIEWMKGHVAVRRNGGEGRGGGKLFAPLLPLACASQQFYVECLTQELGSDVDGLAVYDVATLKDLPTSLHHLPRLGLTEPGTPHEVLRHITLGIDLLTLPFITQATDAGIALDFHFSAPSLSPDATNNNTPLPLGIDMWLPTHAADLSPLSIGCECYTCTHHHRAYIQHLLAAKEMLGWVLLQLHNHHIIDLFFAAVRRSIAKGVFERDVEGFARAYEGRLPEGTGLGPR